MFHHNLEQGSHTKVDVSVSWARAAGIGILTVILGILLLLSCWYCRRRSGYRSLKVSKVPTAESLQFQALPSPSFSEVLGSGVTVS